MADKPKIKKLKKQLVSLTTAFCNTHINDEYSHLCESLINKMARKRAVPFISGRIEIWAAAVIYSIGTINFLFDKKSKPYASHDTICDYFQVSKSTVGQKSKIIRDMFKMHYWDDEFSTREQYKRNPYRQLGMLGGYLVTLDR